MTPMRIAIAGVGGIGKHILDALLRTQHSICILSTRKRPDLESLGGEVFTVDYSSHSTLVAALKGVDLCICAFPCFTDPQACYDAQVHLIHAAEEAGVQKFVPSEWEPLPSRRKTVVDFQEYKNRLIEYLQTFPMRMTWTCFSPGIFLDYYSPTNKGTDGKDKLASSETLWSAGFTFIVDFDQKIAEIPGDGDTGRIALTAADDIGGFVAAACSQLPLSQWPVGEWGFYGGMYTPNQIVSIAQKVRGPLRIEYLSKQSIDAMYETEDSGEVAKQFHWKVLSAVLKDELAIDHQAHGVRYEFQGLEMFVQKWWSGSQSCSS